MEQTYTFSPKGVCSRQMVITYDGDTIVKLEVVGGCRGNLGGIARLVQGMKIKDVAERISGVQCHGVTSCPDQLSVALKEIMAKEGLN